jgi:N-acetylmuramic acid 6-phosphate etherase
LSKTGIQLLPFAAAGQILGAMTAHEHRTQPQCFLGIEGGATRSVAVLVNGAGEVLQRIEAGPGNLKLLSDSELSQLLDSIAGALAKPDAVGIGLAGLRGDNDRSRVLAAASRIWPQSPCLACSDLESALAADCWGTARGGELTRVLVLSGTGSCCYGRDAAGREAKVGGWGHLLGDKGSGYEIGLRALKAVVYYYDRDGSWPALGQRLLRALGLNSPEDLIPWVQSAQKREIARLTVEVFSSWAKRDKIAGDILEGAAHSLARDAVSCARRLSRPERKVQFLLAGSVLLRQPRFSKAVSKLLVELWPRSQVRVLTVESAVGAAKLARDLWAEQASVAVANSGNSSVQQASACAIPLPVSGAMSPTEHRNPRSARLGEMGVAEAVFLMLKEEERVPAILMEHRRSISRAIEWVASALRAGGRLFYVGAGTSGRLGVLDASECPPTFRTSPDQVQGIIAGGAQALLMSIEGAEDDAVAGGQAIKFRGVNGKDVVVGIAASGRTPFVWGALHEASRRRARTILLTFNPHLKIPSAAGLDLMIAPDLGPEVLTGSTRLKAGTATKLLLNMFSTLAMVRLGKVAGNLMVDLNPTNRKLQERAVRIVCELTGVGESRAVEVLRRSRWVVKKAVENLGPRR